MTTTELWHLRSNAAGGDLKSSPSAVGAIYSALDSPHTRVCASALIIADHLDLHRQEAFSAIKEQIRTGAPFDPITELIVVEALQFFPASYLRETETVKFLETIARSEESVARSCARSLLSPTVEE